MSKFLPSEQAAAAVLMAQRKTRRYNLTDISKLEKHTGHTEESLKACV